MVAAHDDTVGLEDGRPAGGFEGLRCLVDEEGAEAAPLHEAVGRAYQRAAHHAGLLKEVGVDFYLKFGFARTKLLFFDFF